MALRLRTMHLPGREADGVLDTRFALIADRAEGLTDEQIEAVTGFGQVISAAGTLVIDREVELDEPDGEQLSVEFDTTALGKSVADALRQHVETPLADRLPSYGRTPTFAERQARRGATQP